CAGIPKTLLESELFGHARGSFDGASRDYAGLLRHGHRGSVLLEAVGELTRPLQARLLQFLETGEVPTPGGGRDVVDVRLIAATDRDLAPQASAAQFQADLFYRLNVVRIDVPPLRSRRE